MTETIKTWRIVAAAAVDVYEAGVRAGSGGQRALATAIRVEPARSWVSACADMSRDLGAAIASQVRWILDV